MKAIRVQYTVRADFAEQNKRNIEAVMRELRDIGDDGIRYASYIHEDGKTFIHLVQYNTTNAERLPGDLESFKRFQAALKENTEVPPKADTFALVDSSFDIF